MQSADKTTPEFKPKITPAQVREKLAKDKANDHTQNFEADVLDKTKPSAEKGAKRKKDATAAKFPVTSRINDYGFIYTKAKWLTALGWHKGMTLKIERNTDGSITVRKT